MGWKNVQRGLGILLGLGLSACAANGRVNLPAPAFAPYPPPGYAHTVETHVALYWNCSRPEEGMLRLAGVAVNPWNTQPIRYLQFSLAGVDAHDGMVSQAEAEAGNILLGTMESTPFQLDLRTAGSEVRFDLYYQYRYQENGGREYLAGPLPPGSLFLAQEVHFMVRDACSPSQHLAH